MKVDITLPPELFAVLWKDEAAGGKNQAFVAAVRSGKPAAVSADDGLMAVLMGLAAQASATTGQAVEIDAQNFRLLR